MSGNGRQTLKNADKAHYDGNGRGQSQSDGGQMILAEMPGHDGVDGAAADDGDVGDEDRSGKTGQRFERGLRRCEMSHRLSVTMKVSSV